MRIVPSTLVSLLILSVSALAQAKGPAPALKPPTAKKVPVNDTFFGKEVTDDYRWLENADDPEVKAWTAAENAYARALLDKLPGIEPIKKRIKDIVSARPAEYFGLVHRKNGLFALEFAPPKQQPMLVLLASPDDPTSKKMILDPTELDPSGKTAIDFFAVTRDGSKVAVSLSQNGTEDGTVYVWETDSKTKLSDVIPRVNGGTAGGGLTWNGDGSGFFYTRYPRGTERKPEDMAFYQQIYFHKLGTPTEQDTYAIGKDFPRIAEGQLDTSDDGKYVIAKIANGDGGEFLHYLFDGTKWTQIAKLEDKIVEAEFGQDGALYLLSKKDAPKGKILRLPLATPVLAQAKVIVPESDATIQHYAPAATRLYVADLLGGPSQLRVFGLDGKDLGKVQILQVSSVGQILHTSGDEIIFRNMSYLQPPAWYRFSPETDGPRKTALYRTAVTDFSNITVTREMATSKDGTKVPVNILRRKDLKLDGNNPAILYGYGGYTVSQVPYFSDELNVWLEQGGVYAIANIRGGGEFGEEWHRAGNLVNKQNVFDDFYAAAQLLISMGFTKSEKLAAEGGSNGGLLMGAMITQHPELFRVVVSHVGVYDMLRAELTQNGQFNVTEYGTVKDKAQFDALYGYSPYHHVKDGTAYPSVLMPIGLADPRVDSWHTKKMLARLQAAAASKRPVLMRTSEFGHGIGTPLDERVSLRAQTFAFVMNELGMKYKPVATPKKAAAKKSS